MKDDFPPGECQPNELIVIDPFEKFNWGVGDFCILKKGLDSKQDLSQVIKGDFDKVPIASLKLKNNNKGTTIKNFINTSVGRIVSLSTFVSVVWQDGTVSEKLASPELIPIFETTDKDFFPNEYVCSLDNEKEIGIIKKVNINDLTCDIKW